MASALSQDGRRSAKGRAIALKESRCCCPKEKKPRARMPLLTIANSSDETLAKEGLERWKARHPKAAELLTVEDVLVDRMRGTSSTWTRIRVNLRNVPEEIRPPQEAPDPDDVAESQRSPGRRPKKQSGSTAEKTTDE